MCGETTGTVTDPGTGEYPPVRIPWLLYLLAALPPLIAAVALGVSYDDIPDPMPVHWGFTGEPDSWEPKSMGTVLAGILLGPGICVTVLLCSAGLVKLESGNAFGPGGARTATDALRSWHELRVMQPLLGWYTVWLSLSLTAMMVGLNGPWAWLGGGVAGWLDALGRVGMVAATGWLLVVMGRRGDEIAAVYPPADGRRRKWLICVDAPGIDSIMVAGSNGSNYTFNTATRGGRIGAVVLFLVLAATAVMMLVMAVNAVL
jgi:uncharacterized membrane protein